MILDETRTSIITETNHTLVVGGPGCGKTTVALLRARHALLSSNPDERVLFLSFSRAAIRQVLDRMSGFLEPHERARIEARTFHSFFIEIIRSHGTMLNSVVPKFLAPDREQQTRAEFEGDWDSEAARLATEDSTFVFDLLAAGAGRVLQEFPSVARLIASRYPMIIVDEFQDTSDDQWKAIKAIASHTNLTCLADPDQRIYGHLKGISDRRIDDLRDSLSPAEFDLSDQNHRSPSSGILRYANAVLTGAPAVPCDEIFTWDYQYPVPPEAVVHRAVVKVADVLEAELGRPASIAVLTRINTMAARASEALWKVPGSGADPTLREVEHILAWDPELTISAAAAVASLLEWPGLDRIPAVTLTLDLIIEFYRTKLGSGVQGARDIIAKLERAVTAIHEGKQPRSNCARVLLQAFDAFPTLTGQPVADWRTVRNLLSESSELQTVNRSARLVRLLRSTDLIAWSLMEQWNGETHFREASATVRAALTDDLVHGGGERVPDVSVMTMHRSKGKEFDAVVILEGVHAGRFFSDDDGEHSADRRLLRVALTRARHVVILVRPINSEPLTPVALRPTA